MSPVASTLVGLAFHTKSVMILFRVKALRVGSTFKTLSTEVLMPEEILGFVFPDNEPISLCTLEKSLRFDITGWVLDFNNSVFDYFMRLHDVLLFAL